jgi:hypothetical protein
VAIHRTQQTVAVECVGYDGFHTAGAEYRGSVGISDQAEDRMAACEQETRQRCPESAVGSGKQDFHKHPPQNIGVENRNIWATQ